MSLNKKIAVTDFASLRLEKERLNEVCDEKKRKLEEKFIHLKENYPEVIMKMFLPFNDETNDKIFKGIKWLNETVSNFVGGSERGVLGKFISGQGAATLQAALIYLGVRLARNIFFKRDKE